MFFAYPNQPSQLGEIIEVAIKKFNSSAQKITSWKAMPIAGSFIAQKIQEFIHEKDLLVADISALNFNVTYEIGYAIGIGKPILLVKNIAIAEAEPTIGEVGIFDTIGFKTYENSDDLVKLFLAAEDIHPLWKDDPNINTKAPVYLIEQQFKSDFATRITGRIKKARYVFRSFDPVEMARLSAYDAINQVSQSHGVLVSLLSKENSGFKTHNLRAAFVAGLAHGMNKVTYILQHNYDPVPIDYRDFVDVYHKITDIDSIIADFAAEIAEQFQEGKVSTTNSKRTILQKLDFGSSSAENEIRNLQEYYLKTDAYSRALRGEVQLVIGRKGSGKSAIFLQIRDRERNKSKNVVLDLKPEGHQLIKFKELILSYLQEGTFQHTIVAFWEYILLLEVCHKVLDNDKLRHLNSTELYEPYRKLESSYKAENYLTEGDFSERMSKLMENLTNTYKSKYGSNKNIRLSSAEITNLLYTSDISALRKDLLNYLKHKDKIWILLDNIDKGWPSSGLQHEDFIIMRTLIDALRSIQRQCSKERIDLFPIIFLRNDVYELLVEQTSDRQKEAKEMLDWIDPDLLREILKLRMMTSLESKIDSFDELWRTVCISHYDGEETSQYIIDRSLMRPRFLINLINQCKGSAVNLNHKIIEGEDIEKGIKSYSTDLLTDISYEIRDVLPEGEDILYAFIDSECEMNETNLRALLFGELEDDTLLDKIIDLLLWHGFLGIRSTMKDTVYIYNLQYNMKLLKGLIQKYKDDTIYVINPSFHPALMIRSKD